jgi:MoaA/NifB/PqqE/SkfB family radical SAM enzyme
LKGGKVVAIKEFTIKQAAGRILPLLSKMSDKDVERLLHLAGKLAPHQFAKSLIDTVERAVQEQNSTAELMRRVIRQTSPHVRQRLVNNLLIKYHWYGSLRRDELRAQGIAAPGTPLISPTMRCNLRCLGCYAANYSKKDDLELEVIDRVLNEGEEMGMFITTILGGEPFIREDMWEIFKRHNDILFQVFTNGTLIDREAAKKLAELGNVLVIFSLEGFEKETDARRGKGVFHKVMEGMDKLREVGVPFGFSSMVTRQNVGTIISDEFNDMLVEKGCLMGWHFLYIPVGLNPNVSLMPTAEQRELMRVQGARRIRNEKPIFVMDFWNDAPYVGGCIAGGRHFFHINSHGDVEPCIFIHLAVDNIHGKSLREVINSPYFRGFRARQPYSCNLLRPCAIIDHPYVLREICAEFNPHSTDGPVCGLVTTSAHDLDRYSEEVAKVMDPLWGAGIHR